MTLLIVDDEPHIRHFMRLTLETAGYQVDEAESGEEGLARFGDGRRYDVVLLDQKMPGIDGLETLKAMKARRPAVRVVMVTAFASIDLAVEAMRHGASDFLRKPMTPDALRGAIAAALARPASAPDTAVPTVAGRVKPTVQTLTLNGFRIVGTHDEAAGEPGTHGFLVTHFPEGAETHVRVAIDPDAVERVNRLARRHLEPTGAFWRIQAERLLSGHLWSEGKLPDTGRLVVRDVSREDIEVAAAWEAD